MIKKTETFTLEDLYIKLDSYEIKTVKKIIDIKMSMIGIRQSIFNKAFNEQDMQLFEYAILMSLNMNGNYITVQTFISKFIIQRLGGIFNDANIKMALDFLRVINGSSISYLIYDNAIRITPLFTLPLKLKDNNLLMPEFKGTTDIDVDGYQYDSKHKNKYLKPICDSVSLDTNSFDYTAINILNKVKWKYTQLYSIYSYRNFMKNKIPLEQIIDMEYALKSLENKEFYLGGKYDSRGRMYYHQKINPQGSEYFKASLEFAYKEDVNSNTLNNLKNEAVKAYGNGYDKCNKEERIKNYELLGLNNPLKGIKYANNPLLLSKISKNINEIKNGDTKTNAKCILDATASGIQLMSLITNCYEGMVNTNIIDLQSFIDPYNVVLSTMKEIMASKNMDRIDIDNLKREDVKPAVMTFFYNSEANPKAIFKKDSILAIFKEALFKCFPGAYALKLYFKSAYDENSLYYEWTLPDGFRCHIKNIVKKYKNIEYVHESGKAKSNFELVYYENYKSNNFRTMSPNIVQSLDAYIARMTIIEYNKKHPNKPIASVHDSFSVNINDERDLKLCHKKAMLMLYKSNIRETLQKDLKSNINIPLMSSKDYYEEITNSKNMLV